MAKRALSPASVPHTFGELLRAVQTVLVSSRAEIERAWVKSYHEIGRLIYGHILLKCARKTTGA